MGFEIGCPNNGVTDVFHCTIAYCTLLAGISFWLHNVLYVVFVNERNTKTLEEKQIFYLFFILIELIP